MTDGDGIAVAGAHVGELNGVDRVNSNDLGQSKRIDIGTVVFVCDRHVVGAEFGYLYGLGCIASTP